MYNSISRGCFEGRSASKSCRKSGRRPAALRVLRTYRPHFTPVGLWESNPECSDTSMDQTVVQDLFNAVAALESGEESDVRRQLSTLAVFSGGESDCKRRSSLPLRRKILRQKTRNLKKKRRPKRKLVSVYSADENPQAHDNTAAIAHPRHENQHLAVPGSNGSTVSTTGAGLCHTSSEDDGSTAALRQLHLFMSDDNSSSATGLRRGDSEVSSSVCVTESELSDTAWEESCDADDELSCFEAPSSYSSTVMRCSSLRAAVASAARAASKHCYGDVEDAYEVDTGASDFDGRQSLMTSGEVDGQGMNVLQPLSNPVVSVSPPDIGHSTVTSSPTPMQVSSLATQSLTRSAIASPRHTSAASPSIANKAKEASKLTSSTSSIGGNDRLLGQASAASPAAAGGCGVSGTTAHSRPSSGNAISGRYPDVCSLVNPAIVSSLRTLNRILFQFVTSRKRTLQLPTMHRRSRRMVWRLASLYQLEWTVEGGSGRSQYAVLTCSKKSCIPDAPLIEQFIREAAQILSRRAPSTGILERLPFNSTGSPALPVASRRSQCLNLQEPMESEEMEADETSATDAGDQVQH